MFWTDNVITLTTGIGANDSGTAYEVNFDYGTAVYAGTHMSQATGATDGLVVEVLRADNSVLATGTYMPGAWSYPTNVNLSAGLQGTLSYTGDGSGNVKIRVRSLVPGSSHFGGEIDNVSVVPEPATLALLGLAGLGLVLGRKRR